VPKVDLSGAYGIPTPPPAAAIANHPDRVARYLRGTRLLWVARLGALAALLYLLFAFHLV
jgi:hypothetical protein